jgi:3-deoxy-manno-octulosonate cytidylyltransferase (CMP-KDO synthetase)
MGICRQLDPATKSSSMSARKVIAVIPARYGSTRFPGKPLAPIAGKPLLQWVWEGAQQSRHISETRIATDDPRIAQTAARFGAQVVMTRADHPSGTDRIAEATQGTQADWILNLQGDEPLITGAFLDLWIEALNRKFGMATVATPLRDPADLENHDMVKVRWDDAGKALGFRRSIPEAESVLWQHQHMGLYAYQPATLQKFVSLPPSPGEKRDRLEQLRALENGIAVQVVPLTFLSVGVDTPGDVTRAERALAERATGIPK